MELEDLKEALTPVFELVEERGLTALSIIGGEDSHAVAMVGSRSTMVLLIMELIEEVIEIFPPEREAQLRADIINVIAYRLKRRKSDER